jgi:phosphoglycerate dehydrogenase-like enzyme
MRIILCYPVEPRHLAEIEAAASPLGGEVVEAGQERVAEEIHAADIFCGHPKVEMDWDRVVQQGRLRWIQSSAAGLDHLLVPSVIESDITITSASGVLADQVAEHAIALITGWMRKLPLFLQAQARREFVRRSTQDLHGKTVAILGFGGVGRRVAELLAPFRTKIIAIDPYPVDRPSHVHELIGLDGLPGALAAADIVILSAPLTPKTRGMIDADRLNQMKKGALLVNIARGPLVVERELVAALDSGQLGGAVVDVTEIEPLPTTSRLWEFPNVIITPHVAGQSSRRADRMTRLFCENLRRFQRKRPLINVVDKRLGFPIRGVSEMYRQDGDP